MIGSAVTARSTNTTPGFLVISGGLIVKGRRLSSIITTILWKDIAGYAI